MLRVLRDRLQRGRNGQRVNITRGQVNPKGMLTSPDGRWHYYKGMWMPAVAGGALDVGEGMDEVHFGFYGDLIPDELATSSDSGTITANVGLSGGGAGRASILRVDNSNNGDNEFAEVDFGALNYQVQDGQMYMKARVLLERVVCAVNVGFNDDTLEGGNTLPVELSGTTWTSGASTWIGFAFDSDATNDNWHVFWVDDDGDTSVPIATLNTGIAVAASVWYTMTIQVTDAGSGNRASAIFDLTDGSNHFHYRASDTIDRDVALVPHIGVENRTTTGAFLDIDDIWAGKSRQDTAP